ncbi:MAG TPA: acylphosphatase [Candidatus Aminicenantes bacterium]|nr:acylphosphatase [Candidatus Aminicenantes bacterium]
METRCYTVTGRVQGVGFRFTARQTARKLEIKGWVRNNPDGSVTVLAHAERHALDALESFLQRGPYGARVDGVDVEIVENTDVGEEFHVRH